MDSIHNILNILFPPLTIILFVCFLPLYLIFKFAYYLKRLIFTENVAGKVVLVTGAASGIGEQIAYEYAKRGAILVLVDIREERLGAVADKVRILGSPDVLAIGADVSLLQYSQRFIQATIDRFGKLDHLVNNAGILAIEPFQNGLNSPESSTGRQRIHNIMDVNFWGTVYGTHFALKHLIKTKGKIIVITSALGRLPVPTFSFYSASKGAVINLYESLRCEIGSDIGITIVTPSLIHSDMSRAIEKASVDLVVPKESKEGCAKAIVKSACRGDKYLMEPWWINCLYFIKVLCPELVEFCCHQIVYRRSIYYHKTSAQLKQH